MIKEPIFLIKPKLNIKSMQMRFLKEVMAFDGHLLEIEFGNIKSMDIHMNKLYKESLGR